jgi:hypothetical protein
VSTTAALVAPLAETALARWLQSAWVYPMLESAHLLSGTLSLLLWAATLIAGRLIAYV